MKKFLLALILMMSPSMASASFVDFSLLPQGGQTSTIAYAGGVNPLIGTNITILNVIGQQTPLLDGVTLPITDGHLDFTTGNFITSTATGWEFAAGGSITFSGNGGVLFSGTFNNPTLVTQVGNTFNIVDSAFTGTISPFLAAQFGVSSSSNSLGALSILFFANATIGGSIMDTGFNSGNAAISMVPEPSSLILVGIGGTSIFLLRKKK